ncbi:MAG: dockerin type I domain-containing protein [Planctomycetota bacterium]|nr:dockerin type I domain-containing protein [Planctomycetota bacterium]
MNDAPLAVVDAAKAIEGNTITLNVLANDSDVEGHHLTIVSFQQPANAVVTEVDGQLHVEPAADFHGLLRFDYTVADDHGGQSTATVEVTVLQSEDVNGDGFVSPIDALQVINFLNANGKSTSAAEVAALDVNKDGHVSPVDALNVINMLNSVGGEGEAAVARRLGESVSDVMAELDEHTAIIELADDSQRSQAIAQDEESRPWFGIDPFDDDEEDWLLDLEL